MKKFLILSISFLLFFASCSTESEDDPAPAIKVNYTTDIKPIIDDNCLSCHTSPLLNGASMPLISLENVREAVENRDLIGRVESGSMPPVGDFLTTTEVQAIRDWKTGGFQK